MFSYNAADPTSDRDRVRLHIGDTLEHEGPRVDGRNFADEELDLLLADGSTWAAAVPLALDIMANEYAAAARRVYFGHGLYQEDYTATARALRQQAAEWRRTRDLATGAVSGGAPSSSEVRIGAWWTNTDAGVR